MLEYERERGQKIINPRNLMFSTFRAVMHKYVSRDESKEMNQQTAKM